MENENENSEVIVDNAENSNEEVAENTEEKAESKETVKPKRTPQEEYEYHKGRADRLGKKLGIKAETVEKPEVNNSSKSSDLDYGQLALLNSMVGLKGKAEIALAKEYISNGRDVLALPEDKFFLQDLQKIRDAKASDDAIPKGKNRSGQTGVTDVDLAVAKYKEDGTLPTDFETRNKVVDAITKEEKGPLFKFK